MDVNNGSSTITIKIVDNFVPDLDLAVKWIQTSSGNYYGTDRGAASDNYRCRCRVAGKETDVKAFVDHIETGRQAGTNTVTLSSFNDGEKIFGENIDYTGSITAFVKSWAPIRPYKFNAWAVDFVFEAVTSSLSQSGVASLPGLDHLEMGWNQDGEVMLNHSISYNGALVSNDKNNDEAIFEGIFQFTNANMQSLLRYIVTQREDDYTISAIGGVDYPFGYRQHGTGYPFTAKLIDFKNLGKMSQQYQRMKLKFAKVF